MDTHKCSYEASERERNVRSRRPRWSARLFFLRGPEFVEQQGDALDFAGGDRLSRSTTLELGKWGLEPPNRVSRFPEEDGKLDKEQSPHALSPDSLVHEPFAAECGPHCGMMTAEDKPT